MNKLVLAFLSWSNYLAILIFIVARIILRGEACVPPLTPSPCACWAYYGLEIKFVLLIYPIPLFFGSEINEVHQNLNEST